MKHAAKRLFSLLLALVMVVGLIPGTGSAAVSVTGSWQTDLTMSAADLGVSAPDSVLRATLTFTNDGHVTADWEAVDLTAFRIFFHDMFVNAYYAMAYGAGITDFAQIEQFCIDSTGMGVSAYMDTLVTDEAMVAAFTPASTRGLYMVDGSSVYLDMDLMGITSDPEIPNPITREGNTLYLNAASFGKSDYTFTCTRLSGPADSHLTDGNPIGSPFRVGFNLNLNSTSCLIHSIDGQKLDNGHYRFTVSYTAPAGSSLFVGRMSQDMSFPLDGRGEFSFDLPADSVEGVDWFIRLDGSNGDLGGAWIKSTGRTLTNGSPIGDVYAADHDYVNDSRLIQLHGITAQRLNNDHIRYTIEYTANAVLNLSVFDPPNGNTFMYYGTPTTPGVRTSQSFDIDSSWLDSASGFTFNFFRSDYESASGFVTPGLLEIPSVDPSNNVFLPGYWYDHSGDAAIRSIEGQRMDNGDTRYTVSYNVPLGSQMRVFDESGNLHYTSLLSGTSGSFYFDFCQYQMPAGEWHIQITNGSSVLANASLFGDGSNCSGGNPTGAPFTPYYDAPDSELVTLHNVTAQYLDNGYVRFSLDYTARTGMNITAFSPPDGDLFSCRAVPTVPGQRATFTFDVAEQHLQERGLTLNFYDHTYGPAFGMIDPFRNENETEIA